MTVCPRCGATVALDGEDVRCNVYGVVEWHDGCPAADDQKAAA